jgi:hypothetical protein
MKRSANVTFVVIWFLAPQFLLSPSLAEGSTDQVASSSLHPDAPLMVWRGVSDVGYLRVELWSRPTANEPHNEDLVVKSASPEYTATYSGVMVQVPYDIKTEPDVRQMYIGIPNLVPKLSVLATLSADGTLRLYECGMRTLLPPCVLHPLE